MTSWVLLDADSEKGSGADWGGAGVSSHVREQGREALVPCGANCLATTPATKRAEWKIVFRQIRYGVINAKTPKARALSGGKAATGPRWPRHSWACVCVAGAYDIRP